MPCKAVCTQRAFFQGLQGGLCVFIRPMLAEPLWWMVSGSLGTSELPREEDFQRLAAFHEKPQGVRQEWLSSPLPPPWGNAVPVSGPRSLPILCPASPFGCGPEHSHCVHLHQPLGQQALAWAPSWASQGSIPGSLRFLPFANETTGPKKSRALVGSRSCWCAHRGCRR